MAIYVISIMEFNKQNIQSKVSAAETHVIDEGLRAYMLKVYNFMASGVLLTGIVSLIVFEFAANVPELDDAPTLNYIRENIIHYYPD